MKTVLTLMLAASAAGSPLAQTAADQAVQTAPSLAARIAAMPMNLPRAKGPSLQTATALAAAAAETCKAKGANVSVLVTDSAGTPIAMLLGDGASARSQLISQSKAYTVVKYRMPSGDVKRNAKADPKLAREISLDPNIGEARRGAFPLMRDGELIGVLSVSGVAAGGNEDCAQDAMAKVPLR